MCGELGEGERGRGKGRGSCREQWQDSLWGRDPPLGRGPGRLPPRPPLTHPVCGGKQCHLWTKETPTRIPARNRTFTPPCALFPKLFTATQQQNTIFFNDIVQRKKRRLGPSKLAAQRGSLALVPSATAQRLGSQSRTEGRPEERCGLQGARLACALSPG